MLCSREAGDQLVEPQPVSGTGTYPELQQRLAVRTESAGLHSHTSHGTAGSMSGLFRLFVLWFLIGKRD